MDIENPPPGVYTEQASDSNFQAIQFRGGEDIQTHLDRRNVRLDFFVVVGKIAFKRAHLGVEFPFSIGVLCFVGPNALGFDGFSEWARHVCFLSKMFAFAPESI